MTRLKVMKYFKGSKPIHRESYCAFLDVLGFSDRIKESFGLGKGDDLLQEFHTILSENLKKVQKDVSISNLYAKSFTDNVVFAHPQFSRDLESEFAFVLWSIKSYQFEMAQHGFFIRGGISFGPLFVDKNSVYGPALIEAYEIEKSVSINPIVTLSDKVKALVLSHVGFYGAPENAPQNSDVLIDARDKFFINYLSEASEEEFVDWQALRNHKQQIEWSLEKYKANSQVFAKLSWMAGYHNYFCEPLKSHSGYDPSLKILNNAATVSFKTIASR
jgi:hypothetical protein